MKTKAKPKSRAVISQRSSILSDVENRRNCIRGAARKWTIAFCLDPTNDKTARDQSGRLRCDPTNPLRQTVWLNSFYWRPTRFHKVPTATTAKFRTVHRLSQQLMLRQKASTGKQQTMDLFLKAKMPKSRPVPLFSGMIRRAAEQPPQPELITLSESSPSTSDPELDNDIDFTLDGFFRITGEYEAGRHLLRLCECSICGREVRTNSEYNLHVHAKTHTEYNGERFAIDYTFGGQYEVLSLSGSQVSVRCRSCGKTFSSLKRYKLRMHLTSSKHLNAKKIQDADESAPMDLDESRPQSSRTAAAVGDKPSRKIRLPQIDSKLFESDDLIDLTMNGFYTVLGTTNRNEITLTRCQCSVCHRIIRAQHEGPLRLHGRTHPDEWNGETAMDWTVGGRFRVITRDTPMLIQCLLCGKRLRAQSRARLLEHLRSLEHITTIAETNVSNPAAKEEEMIAGPSGIRCLSINPPNPSADAGNRTLHIEDSAVAGPSGLQNPPSASICKSAPSVRQFASVLKVLKRDAQRHYVQCLICKWKFACWGGSKIRTHLVYERCRKAQVENGMTEVVNQLIEQSYSSSIQTIARKRRSEVQKDFRTEERTETVDSLTGRFDRLFEELFTVQEIKNEGHARSWALKCCMCDKVYLAKGNSNIWAHLRTQFCIEAQKTKGMDQQVANIVDRVNRSQRGAASGSQRRLNGIKKRLTDRAKRCLRIDTQNHTVTDWTFGGVFKTLVNKRGIRRQVKCKACNVRLIARQRGDLQKHMITVGHLTATAQMANVTTISDGSDKPTDETKRDVNIRGPGRKNIDWTFGGRFRLVTEDRLPYGILRAMECLLCNNVMRSTSTTTFRTHLRRHHGIVHAEISMYLGESTSDSSDGQKIDQSMDSSNSSGVRATAEQSPDSDDERTPTDADTSQKIESDDSDGRSHRPAFVDPRPREISPEPVGPRRRIVHGRTGRRSTLQTAAKTTGRQRSLKTLPKKNSTLWDCELVDWTLNGNFRLISRGPVNDGHRVRVMECVHCLKKVSSQHRRAFVDHLGKCNAEECAKLPPLTGAYANIDWTFDGNFRVISQSHDEFGSIKRTLECLHCEKRMTDKSQSSFRRHLRQKHPEHYPTTEAQRRRSPTPSEQPESSCSSPLSALERPLTPRTPVPADPTRRLSRWELLFQPFSPDCPPIDPADHTREAVERWMQEHGLGAETEEWDRSAEESTDEEEEAEDEEDDEEMEEEEEVKSTADTIVISDDEEAMSVDAGPHPSSSATDSDCEIIDSSCSMTSESGVKLEVPVATPLVSSPEITFIDWDNGPLKRPPRFLPKKSPQ